MRQDGAELQGIIRLFKGFTDVYRTSEQVKKLLLFCSVANVANPHNGIY